ncbi:MAG: hypothetical protein L0Y60_02735 [Beijerinckiaceae bacterium]|nr:hypothetical protein [Beijerinckiaceae bacterium]
MTDISGPGPVFELDPCSPYLLERNPPIGGSSNDPAIPGASGTHCSTGPGIEGTSRKGDGVVGRSEAANKSGVWGGNTGQGVGVAGSSAEGDGVVGQSGGANKSGVWGGNTGKGVGVAGSSAEGIGVLGQGGHLAGRFEGNVEVTGDINGTDTSTITCFDVSLIGGDCAEDFDIAIAHLAEPGTVMVLGSEGELEPCQIAYDKRVTGVISGAGDYKPGIVLDKQRSKPNRKPIALLGKVFCKVDAQYGAVETGDLLTTSPTSGHAMKAENPLQASGAVIGKAMRPLKDGQALIPILIALQ